MNNAHNNQDTFNVRAAHGFTFQGGTSTGKVVDNFCDIRNAVPTASIGGSLLLNPYCLQQSPWQTAFPGLAIYTIPHIGAILSTVYQDKPNVGTDQLSSSLQANDTLTAADMTAVAAQLGRPMTTSGPVTINLIPPGTLYGPRVRELDLSMKKVIRVWGRRLTGGLDIYNVLNNNVALAFNQTYAPGVAGWLAPTTCMNPRVFRLSAEFAF